MNFIERSKLTGENISLKETEDFLKDLKVVKKGNISSKIPTINNLEIEFGWDFEAFTFKTNQINTCENPSQYQYTHYGILEPFEISYNGENYKILNGAKTSVLHWKTMTLSGSIGTVENNFLENETCYFRALLPLDRYAKPPLKYFLGRGIINNESIRIAGYIDININQNIIGMYDYELNDKKYIIIDCKTKTDFETFECLMESIVYSFALISGNLIRNHVTIIRFQNPDFSNIEGFRFKKLKENVISQLEIYNPQEHKEYFNLSETLFFPIRDFSNLCQLSYNSKPLLRAIRTLTQARNQPIEIETAAFFITLETIKQLIIEENEEKISPFKNKKSAKSAVKKLRDIIKSLPGEEFNDKEAVIRKIENINSIGNTDGFKLAFELMGINLTSEDINCINNRNKFLHGNIPYDHETKENRKKELSKINLNAHLITCALILKYAGYNGPLKNYLKYLDLMNGHYLINQPLFRII